MILELQQCRRPFLNHCIYRFLEKDHPKTPSYAEAIHCQKCCDNAWAYQHLVVQWATSTGVVGRRMSTSGWRIPLDSACDSIRFSDVSKAEELSFSTLSSTFCSSSVASSEMNSKRQSQIQFCSSLWVVSNIKPLWAFYWKCAVDTLIFVSSSPRSSVVPVVASIKWLPVFRDSKRKTKDRILQRSWYLALHPKPWQAPGSEGKDLFYHCLEVSYFSIIGTT